MRVQLEYLYSFPAFSSKSAVPVSMVSLDNSPQVSPGQRDSFFDLDEIPRLPLGRPAPASPRHSSRLLRI
jgi:hypothetical protein